MALRVGPQTLAVGTTTDGRSGAQGDTIGSNLNGYLYEANKNQTLFHVANQAATVTTVALATTYTGICLSNPVGNLKNIQLTAAGYSFTVAPAAPIAVGLMVGYNATTNVTHTAAITAIKSGYVGIGPAPTALADSSATLPTAPWVERILGTVDTGAITTTTQTATGVIPVDGAIILPPGGYVAIFTSTVSGASGFWGSFQWIESPIG
jgi:hypothetical protein